MPTSSQANKPSNPTNAFIRNNSRGRRIGTSLPEGVQPPNNNNNNIVEEEASRENRGEGGSESGAIPAQRDAEAGGGGESSSVVPNMESRPVNAEGGELNFDAEEDRNGGNAGSGEAGNNSSQFQNPEVESETGGRASGSESNGAGEEEEGNGLGSEGAGGREGGDGDNGSETGAGLVAYGEEYGGGDYLDDESYWEIVDFISFWEGLINHRTARASQEAALEAYLEEEEVVALVYGPQGFQEALEGTKGAGEPDRSVVPAGRATGTGGNRELEGGGIGTSVPGSFFPLLRATEDRRRASRGSIGGFGTEVGLLDPRAAGEEERLSSRRLGPATSGGARNPEKMAKPESSTSGPESPDEVEEEIARRKNRLLIMLLRQGNARTVKWFLELLNPDRNLRFKNNQSMMQIAEGGSSQHKRALINFIRAKYDLIETNAVFYFCALCEIYEQPFDRTTLREHENGDHASLYYCYYRLDSGNVCEFETDKPCRLKSHIEVDHLNKRFECIVCGKLFRAISSLRTHLKDHDRARRGGAGDQDGPACL